MQINKLFMISSVFNVIENGKGMSSILNDRILFARITIKYCHTLDGNFNCQSRAKDFLHWQMIVF